MPRKGGIYKGMTMSQFKAVMVTKDEAGAQHVAWATIGEADLMEGDVVVRISHSTINYKDGLVLSAKSAVPRKFPMIAGIDFAGVVESSSHAGFKAGDAVLLNGYLYVVFKLSHNIPARSRCGEYFRFAVLEK